MSKVNSELAAAIAQHLQMEENIGAVSDQCFYDNLPDGLSQEIVGVLRDYESDYSVAAGMALADAGVGYIKENPDTEMLTGEFGMGSGVTLNHSYMRNTETSEWSSVTSIEREIGDLVDTIQSEALSRFSK